MIYEPPLEAYRLYVITLLVVPMYQLSDPLTERKVLFWGDFGWALFLPNPAVFAVGEPLCDVETPS